MKTIKSIVYIFACLLCFRNNASAQDTSINQRLNEEHTYDFRKQSPASKTKPHIYRDTRLGSSSPFYNTYKKNDYGAGAITTNPNKSQGIAQYPGDHFDSGKHSKIYRDTRLGGSSPLYNTYKKNDYGAGAITTNPNKNAGSLSTVPYSPPDTTRK